MQRSSWPNSEQTTTMPNKKRTPPSLRSALLLASTSGASPPQPSEWALCAQSLSPPPPTRALPLLRGLAVGCPWPHTSRCPCPASRCPCLPLPLPCLPLPLPSQYLPPHTHVPTYPHTTRCPVATGRHKETKCTWFSLVYWFTGLCMLLATGREPKGLALF
jgi:hypothetical protein